MMPEFAIFMLAAARLGACFTVISSGFSADSLADRLVDADAKLLVTADVGRRRGNLVKLKEVADRPRRKPPVLGRSLSSDIQETRCRWTKIGTCSWMIFFEKRPRQCTLSLSLSNPKIPSSYSTLLGQPAALKARSTILVDT